MLFGGTVILPHLTTQRQAKTSARELAARLADLLRLAWRKVCPWDPGDIPELDALYAPPRRPPLVPRHRFGRRSADEGSDLEVVDVAATKKQLAVVGPGSSVSPSKRH